MGAHFAPALAPRPANWCAGLAPLLSDSLSLLMNYPVPGNRTELGSQAQSQGHGHGHFGWGGCCGGKTGSRERWAAAQGLFTVITPLPSTAEQGACSLQSQTWPTFGVLLGRGTRSLESCYTHTVPEPFWGLGLCLRP